MNWFKLFMLVEIGTWIWMYRSGKTDLAMLALRKAGGDTLTADEERQLKEMAP